METSTLADAVSYLAARCDGAEAQDQRGFNKPDSPFGRLMAGLPVEIWSPAEYAATYHMVWKYREQLAAGGFDVEAFDRPTVEETARLARVDRHEDVLVIRFPYDPMLVAAVRQVPGRHFQGEKKYWTAPATMAQADAIEALLRLGMDAPPGLVKELRQRKEMPAVTSNKTKPASPPPRRIEHVDGQWIVTAPYNEDLVNQLRTLPRSSRRWDKKALHWAIDTTPAVASGLAALASDHHLYGAEEVQIWAATVADEQSQAGIASRATEADLTVEGLGGEPMPFQWAGVAYGMRKRRVLIADEMGLGKTIEALVMMQALDAFPALVICPATLKRNWQREASRWLPGRSVGIVNGGTASQSRYVIEGFDVVIINYDLLTTKKRGTPAKKGKKTFSINDYPTAKALMARGFRSVTLDEAHYAKNYKAQRTKVCKAIAKDIDVRLLLTGTPVLNRPQELISPLQILGCLDDFGGFWSFMDKCGMVRGAHGLETAYESADHRSARLAALNDELRRVCMIRRTKDEVLKELPAKRRATVPLPIDNQAEYRRAVTDFIEWLRKTKGDEAARKAKRAEQLSRIEHLKMLSAQGKLAATIEWVESFLESGEKLVLFAHHRAIQQAIAERFPGAAVIRGEDNSNERDANVQRFQEDPACRLIVCSLKAGGIGITLTAASNVAFVELGWTPADHDQAEDRCHRIGQASSVTAWYLLAENTIEEPIATLIDSKRRDVDAITDGATRAPSVGILDALLGELLEAA